MRPWEQRLTDRWWIRRPLLLRYVGVTPFLASMDGYVLTTKARLGAIAPPVALLLGLLVGWKTWGYAAIFSESLLLMALIAALGTLSAHLGGALVVGLAFGDFVLRRESWTLCCSVDGFLHSGFLAHFARERVPLLILYALLVFLAVLVPLAVKGLVSELRPADLPRRYQAGVAVTAHVLLTGALVYLWAQTVPVLIRPAWTWVGIYDLPVEAVQPLQLNSIRIVLVAMAASAGRMAWQLRTADRPELGAQIDLRVSRIQAAEPVRPFPDRLPPLVRIVLQAATATVMMSGLFLNWIEGLVVGVVVLGLLAVRLGLIRVPLGPWPRIARRIPLAARMLAGLLIVYIVARIVVPGGYTAESASTFRPITITVVVAMIVFALLNPPPDPARGGPS